LENDSLLSSRRTFLQNATALALLPNPRAALPQQGMQHRTASNAALPANAVPAVGVRMLRSVELASFVDPLPLPQRIVAPKRGKLRIAMREIHAKVHRDVPPTRMWSYGATALGPQIEARSRRTLRVEWVNELPRKHFLPIDYSLHGCGHDVPEVRACVHLHGGRTPSQDDGYPEDWYIPGKSRLCTYPLEQDAAALWYHDHAMGINRLNIYAGLVGQLMLRDEAEDALDLPSGAYEIPLILYDRILTADGQLFYPTSGDPAHPWVTEFDGDAVLVNGKIRPFLEVEPRVYRFRALNAANSRFFALSLSDHQTFHQIGSDQGLLSAPVALTSLLLSPAERADLLIDFSGHAGKRIHLYGGALEMMEFRVAATPSVHTALPATLRSIPNVSEAEATVTRTVTLNEIMTRQGISTGMLLNRKHWHEPVTETPKLNSTEIWEFVNLTEDVHPMHLHLVRFRILDRRTFEPFDFQTHQTLRYLGPATPPEPNERGWKDVVQCPPGQVTRILVTFDGYPGRYLYHCHILEHESNDMMRPFKVIA
jgi:spore coat protein A